MRLRFDRHVPSAFSPQLRQMGVHPRPRTLHPATLNSALDSSHPLCAKRLERRLRRRTTSFGPEHRTIFRAEDAVGEKHALKRVSSSLISKTFLGEHATSSYVGNPVQPAPLSQELLDHWRVERILTGPQPHRNAGSSESDLQGLQLRRMARLRLPDARRRANPHGEPGPATKGDSKHEAA